MLATLKHPNIIRLMESTQDSGGGWLLIMEYAATGSLLDYCSAQVRPRCARCRRCPQHASRLLKVWDVLALAPGIRVTAARGPRRHTGAGLASRRQLFMYSCHACHGCRTTAVGCSAVATHQGLGFRVQDQPWDKLLSC